MVDAELLDQLESFDEGLRRVGLQSLACRGEEAAPYAQEMGRLLEDEDVEVRKAAAAALGKVGRKASDQARRLAAALGDDYSSVRAEATRALGALGPGPETGAQLEKIVALARDPEEEPQKAAVGSLAALGDAPRLGPFLASSFVGVVRAALVEVGRCPRARVMYEQVIADKISHKDASVQLAAVQAAGELGQTCGEAHLSALGGLRSREAQVKVRRAAVQALGRIGEAGVEQLLQFFQDADESVRHNAAQTLASVGGQSAGAGALRLLEDGNPRTRQTALAALGRLQFEDDSAPSASIARLLRDQDFECRLAAIQALSDLVASSQAEAVGALCSDTSKGIRQAAVNALAKMSTNGAVQAVVFLDDSDPAVRQAAVRVFSPMHSKLPAEVARQHSEAVAYKLLDTDWRVRFAAVVALGDLGASEFVEQVAALSGDKNEQVRRSAVTCLEKLAAPAAHVAAFLGDEDSGVRSEAQRAYTALSGRAGADDDDGELSEVE